MQGSAGIEPVGRRIHWVKEGRLDLKRGRLNHSGSNGYAFRFLAEG